VIVHTGLPARVMTSSSMNAFIVKGQLNLALAHFP